MPDVDQYEPKITVKSVTIANGGTTSDSIKLRGTTPVVVQMPAAITGTNLMFEGSIDNGSTFTPINNSVGRITFVVAANTSFVLNPANFIGYDEIKLVMDVQGAERIIPIKPFKV